MKPSAAYSMAKIEDEADDHRRELVRSLQHYGPRYEGRDSKARN
jgi:hypothetical protein